MEALRAIAFGIGTLAAIWAVERALAWLSWTLAGPFPAREEMAVLFSFLIVLAVIYGGIWGQGGSGLGGGRGDGGCPNRLPRRRSLAS